MIFGFEIAYNELWLGGESGVGYKYIFLRYIFNEESLQEDNDEDMHEGFPVKVNGTHMIPVVSVLMV